MKINESGRVNGISSYQRNIDRHDQHIEKKQKKDQVSISMEAMEMLDAQKHVSSPAREERIQQLKHEVSTGTYHVDAKQIAEKMFPYFKSYTKLGE